MFQIIGTFYYSIDFLYRHLCVLLVQFVDPLLETPVIPFFSDCSFIQIIRPECMHAWCMNGLMHANSTCVNICMLFIVSMISQKIHA